MKFVLSILVAFLLVANVTGIKAASTTEEVCTTDSYGNRTCSTSTNTTTTSEVTYTGTGGDTTSTEILNTSMPTAMQVAAVAIIALGAASLILKKKLVK